MAEETENISESGRDAAVKAWWQSDAFFIGAVVLACLAAVWMMARAEVVSRAKERYQTAELYYSWIKDPAKKQAYYDAQLKSGQIDALDYQRYMEDSAVKNAFVEYETVIDLFQPPKSQWVTKSEERMKEVKPLYVKFLADLGIEYIE
jgi:hypothetical protein